MSEDKNIEKLFGEKLKEFNAQPPPDLKRSVEETLMREKLIKPDGNNNKHVYFFIIIALLITVSIIVYIIKNNTYYRMSNASDVTSKSTETIIKQTKTANTLPQSKPRQIKSNKHERTNTNEEINTSLIIRHDNVNGSKESNNNSETETNQKVRSESNKPGVITGQQLKKQKVSLQKENQKRVSENKNKVVIAARVNGNQNSDMAISQNSKALSDFVKKVNSDAKDEPAKDVNSNSENDLPFETDSIQDSGQVTLTDTTARKEEEKSTQTVTDSKPDTMLKQKSRAIFGIDLYTGPQWHKSNWTQVQNLPDPVSSPGNAESPEITFAFGAALNLNFKNFLIESGANFYNQKSSFNYSESLTTYDTLGGFWTYKDTTFWVLDTNQIDTIFYTIHIDSTYNYQLDTTTSTKNNQIKNSISVVEVPLLFGYNFSKGKFDFELKAGPSIAIITKVNYTTYIPGTIEAITYDTKSDSPIRSYYLNLNIRLNVIYNFNKNFGVFIMPSSSIGIGSIFKSDYAYEKRLKSVSVYGGLRIKF